MTDTITNRPPHPGEWFRVHPYQQKEIVLLHFEGKEYLLADNMVQHLRENFPERAHLLQPTMAFMAVNKDQEPFIWCVPMPVPDDHPAYRAMEHWICLRDN